MPRIVTCLVFLLCTTLMVVTEGAPIRKTTETSHAEGNCTTLNTEQKESTGSIPTGITLIVEPTTNVSIGSIDLTKETKETSINEKQDNSDGLTKVSAMKDSNGNVAYANLTSKVSGYIENQHMITEVIKEGSPMVSGENSDLNSFPIHDADSKIDSVQTGMVNTSDDIQTGMHDNSSVHMKNKMKNYPETNDPLKINDHSRKDNAMKKYTEKNATPSEKMTISMQSKDDKKTTIVVELENNEKYNAHTNQMGVSETKEGGLGHADSSTAITDKENEMDLTENSSNMPLKKDDLDSVDSPASMTIKKNGISSKENSSYAPIDKNGPESEKQSADMTLEETFLNSKDTPFDTRVGEFGSNPGNNSASMTVEEDGMNSKDNSSNIPVMKDGLDLEDNSTIMTIEENVMNDEGTLSDMAVRKVGLNPGNNSSSTTVEEVDMNSKDNSSNTPIKKDGSDLEDNSTSMTIEGNFMNNEDTLSDKPVRKVGSDPRNNSAGMMKDDINSKENSSNMPVLEPEKESANMTVKEDFVNSKGSLSNMSDKKYGSEPEKESSDMTFEEDFMNSKENSSNMLTKMDDFGPKNKPSDMILEDSVMNYKSSSSDVSVKKNGLGHEDNSFNKTIEEDSSNYKDSSSNITTGEDILDIGESPSSVIKEEKKDIAKTKSPKIETI
ncbi:uncharacterized protein LOC143233949 [Tachypleus tridentatus]|uniref:uncharacterized protein LOC143233949 n=1 Tax=Tachypleus tridentatus TaxID=6853 RepID=UPI003FD01EA3